MVETQPYTERSAYNAKLGKAEATYAPTNARGPDDEKNDCPMAVIQHIEFSEALSSCSH